MGLVKAYTRTTIFAICGINSLEIMYIHGMAVCYVSALRFLSICPKNNLIKAYMSGIKQTTKTAKALEHAQILHEERILLLECFLRYEYVSSKA